MRCAIYCRLSREDEEKSLESESIQNQKSLLLDHARQQEWEVVRLYCDEDYSGADRSRPAFSAMLREARQGAFDIILCKTQSRFTRDMELVERYIHGLFPLWGIRFVAVADHIDTSLQGNKKARQINGLVNEWYLEDLSENIRMVLDHKRQQGRHIGGCALYGYRKDPDEKGHLIPDPPAAEVVRQIFQLALEGHGKQAIAAMLNERGLPNPSRYKQEAGLTCRAATEESRLWNRSTVGRILKNEMYLGHMIQGRNRKLSYKSKQLQAVPAGEWVRVEHTHEPIIDAKTFAAVQALRAPRAKSGGSGAVHPLAGLVCCAHCGAALHKQSYLYKGNRRSYLRCRQKSCACAVRLEELLTLVEDQIRGYACQWAPHALHSLALGWEGGCTGAAPRPEEQRRLCARQDKYTAALESLYLDKVAGLLSDAQFRLLSERLSQTLESLRQQAEDMARATAADASCTPAADTDADRPLPRRLLLCLIRRIELSPRSGDSQELVIHWRF